MMIPLRRHGKPVDGFVVFGQVLGGISTTASSGRAADTAAMKPIARCGYHDYAVVGAPSRWCVRNLSGCNQMPRRVNSDY